jgi:predicted nucleotidyltransferase component of viral defense system
MRNYAASVRNRLLESAKQQKTNFDLILTRFALERLLYRLSISAYSDRFLLKGAMIFALWMQEPHRPTRDLDLLGIRDSSAEDITEIFRSLCVIDQPEDGLIFHPDSVSVTAIREETISAGFRVLLSATLEQAQIRLQIDIGFGDSVVPEPLTVTYPTLLLSPYFPAPRLRAYQKETVIAEKFEAMVTLEMGNSRMKDFYDVYTLSQTFAFDGRPLAEAIAATFVQRGTTLPAHPPVALTPIFSEDAAKRQQWTAFLKRASPPTINSDANFLPLSEVVSALAAFLLPLLEYLRQDKLSSDKIHWLPGGPWQSTE